MRLSLEGERKAKKIRKKIMRDLEGGNRMRNHWFMIILFVFAMQCLDHFVLDRISKASKTMAEVQEIVKPDTAEVDTIDEYEFWEFFRDKYSLVEARLYKTKIIDDSTAQALWKCNERWQKQQQQKISCDKSKECWNCHTFEDSLLDVNTYLQEIEEEIEKEE